MGDIVQTASAEQKELEAKLFRDKTKTKQAKALFSAEVATKRMELIWNRADKKLADIKGELSQYDKKLDTELKFHGTTDFVILNSYASVLKDMTVSQFNNPGRGFPQYQRCAAASGFRMNRKR